MIHIKYLQVAWQEIRPRRPEVACWHKIPFCIILRVSLWSWESFGCQNKQTSSTHSSSIRKKSQLRDLTGKISTLHLLNLWLNDLNRISYNFDSDEMSWMLIFLKTSVYRKDSVTFQTWYKWIQIQRKNFSIIRKWTGKEHVSNFKW